MTTFTQHPLAVEYLQRLRRAGHGLPAGRRRELLADIEGHLAEAIDPGAPDAQALTVLDKLGEPEAIIAAENPRSEELPSGRGTKEWAAVILLLVGGFLLGVGWFVGLILLWNSRAWNLRDKWVGTLLIPGGLAISVIVGLVAIGAPDKNICHGVTGGPQRCTNAVGQHVPSSGAGIAVCAVVVLIPIATALYLARRAARDR